MNYQQTDFNSVKDYVKQLAISTYAKQEIDKREPSSHLDVVEKRQQETLEAVALLTSGLAVPFMGLADIERLTQKVAKRK